MKNSQRVQYRIQWPPFSRSVVGLAVLFFALWLLSVLVEPVGLFARAHLWLTTTNVFGDLELWTLLTYAFFHVDFGGVFFTALALWLFGGELERRWSPKKWWSVQLGAVLLGGAISAAALWIFGAAGTVVGYHAAIFALVTAYCSYHWDRKLSLFVVEMRGKTMLLLFLGLSVALTLFSGTYMRLALDAAGLAVGFAATDRLFRASDLRTRYRRWKARRHLKVVSKRPEDDKKGGKSGKRKTNDGQWIN